MKYLSRIIILSLCLLSGTAIRAQVHAEQVLNIGRNVLAMDDYVLAIQYFNQAAAAKPYLWDPYYYRALAKLMLDDFHGAENDASDAIERNKFKYEAYRVRGFARMRLRLDSAAIEDFNKGLAYAPDDKYFLYYKGLAQASLGDFTHADSTFSHLLNIYPRFEDGYGSRAQAHLMAADTVAAIKDISEALRINPNMLPARLMRADISLHRRQWAAAAADLDTVIKLSPADVSLYINRAYARYNADDWPGAMADYNYALDLEPQNYAAIYNRALLRYQIQDLSGARNDFSKVLEHDPDDFPARYNRGLINTDLGNHQAALADFRLIANKYPRFYPVFYAMSRVYQNMGNAKLAADYFFKANDLISRYTDDPAHYKLDRPAIQNGSSREQSDKSDPSVAESAEDVMEHFNELVTVSHDRQSTPLYGEKLRGRVQDIDMRVQPAQPYALSFEAPVDEIRQRYDSYAELTEINSSGWLDAPLFLTTGTNTPDDAYKIQSLFDFVHASYATQQAHELRPIDFLARAVALTSLKNYEDALGDLNDALKINPGFVSALLQRAYVYPLAASALNHESGTHDMMSEASAGQARIQAMEDYDAALSIDPRLPYAWMGKGCLLYESSDYAGAAGCFSQALELAPDLGPAMFNRALCMLRLGRKREAVADLSRAGELGVVAAYNLLKNI